MKACAPKGSPMLRRLRWKSIAVMMCLVAVFITSILTVLFFSTRAGFEKRTVEAMADALRRASAAGSPAPPGRRPDFIPLLVTRVSPQGQASLIENRIYYLEEEEALRLSAGLYAAGSLPFGETEGYPLRYLRETLENGTWYVFADITQEHEVLKAQLLHSLLLWLMTLTLFFPISLLLARWMVRPVEKAWEEQRQFVADASHELKTPLTVVLSNMDMLMSAQAVSGEKNLARLDNIRAESQRMRGLVESLLTLARSDRGQEAAPRQRLSLSRLATYSLLTLEPAIFDAGRSLTYEIAPGLTLWGDEGRLRQLIDILLDNACKYSPPGSTIEVTLSPGPKREAVLSVRSQGTPIPPQERQAIFRRFYRSDHSRSQESGYGLGLSIAQAIVSAHGGRIVVRSEDAHSNTFQVRLPRA